MKGINKNLRFLVEIITVAITIFVLLFIVGQIERLIGLTSEVTNQFSLFMIIANLILVYVGLNETLLRWLPFKFFRRKPLKNSKLSLALVIAIIIIVFVFIMSRMM